MLRPLFFRYKAKNIIAAIEQTISVMGVAQMINSGPIALLFDLDTVKKTNIKGISKIPFLNNANMRLLQGFPTAWKKEIIV